MFHRKFIGNAVSYEKTGCAERSVCKPAFLRSVTAVAVPCAAAVMTRAVMAGMIRSMVMTAVARAMMAAHGIRIVVQRTGQKGFHLSVSISGRSRKQADPRLCQSISRSASYISADQNLHA